MQAPIKENSNFDKESLGKRIKRIRGELTQPQFSKNEFVLWGDDFGNPVLKPIFVGQDFRVPSRGRFDFHLFRLVF